MTRERQERISGWVLAGLVFVHLLLLRDASGVPVAVIGLLTVGITFRWRNSYPPEWIVRLLLLAGIIGVLVANTSSRPAQTMGGLAMMGASVMLLRPLTPSRGLRIVFCVLAALAAIVLRRDAGIGPAFIIADVIVLMTILERIHRPPEAALSLWVSLSRSMQLVIPVAVVVSLIFWFFPNLSLPVVQTFAGFAGSETLNPGEVAQVAQSRRVALVARFARAERIPKAGELYWRGQVLERNEGLRWARDPGRRGRPKSFESTVPGGSAAWKYSQRSEPNPGGILAVLDRAISVEARRSGQDVVVLDLGAGVLTAVGGGELEAVVTASPNRSPDAPEKSIAGGDLDVPEAARANPNLRELAGGLVRPERPAAANLQALGEHLRGAGYLYTMRPGRMPSGDVAGFLFERRGGFCEHYAAAAANILRLGGIPARVVTGYRGGEWNPWLRSITVRSSDAHAWVEAWDEAGGQWLRFDPTAFVAPEISARLEREWNSDAWPWYRLAASLVGAVASESNERVEGFFLRIGASELWEMLQPVFLAIFLVSASAWLLRNFWRRRAKSPAEFAMRLLARLETEAARRGRRRYPGETPLAWLARLARDASGPRESEFLRQFSACYEAGVYRAGLGGPANQAGLRRSARMLHKAWRTTG